MRRVHEPRRMSDMLTIIWKSVVLTAKGSAHCMRRIAGPCFSFSNIAFAGGNTTVAVPSIRKVPGWSDSYRVAKSGGKGQTMRSTSAKCSRELSMPWGKSNFPRCSSAATQPIVNMSKAQFQGIPAQRGHLRHSSLQTTKTYRLTKTCLRSTIAGGSYTPMHALRRILDGTSKVQNTDIRRQETSL